MRIEEVMKKVIWKASLLLLLGLLLFVFYHSLSAWNAAPFFMEKVTDSWRRALAVISVSVLFFLFLSVKKIIWKREEKQLKKAALALLAVFALLQFLYLYAMKVGLRYDALKTVDEAISVCRTGVVSAGHLDGYFARYTNNYPILFLTIALLKLFGALRILGSQCQNAVFLLGMFNILMIDVGIFFGWRLMGHIKGERTAFLCLIFALLNPLFLIWSPFYYTNTVSMGLMMAALYGLYRLFGGDMDHSFHRKDCLLAVLCGMTLWAGCRIRATVFITVIAAVAYVCLKERKTGNEAVGILNRRKLGLTKLLFLGVGVLVMAAAFKAAEKKYVPFDTTDTAFPAVHWIAMGAGGQGVYNIVDEYYTMGFETKEEKISGDMELLKERISQLGVVGYAKLTLDKLKLTWSDGSGGYLSELGVSQSYLPVHKYFLGSRSDFLGAYGAVFYSFCLAMAIAGVIVGLRKERMDFFYIIQLNLLGGFLFHMLWEAGTIYSIGFMTLLPLAMAEGFEWLTEAPGRSLRGKAVHVSGYVCAALAAGLVILGIVGSDVFFKQDYVTNEATVNQFLYQCEEDDPLLGNELYVQTFLGDKEFNRLGVQVYNRLGEGNSSAYRILLLDGEKSVVASEEVFAKDVSGYQFITLSFDMVDGKKGTGPYYVVVERTGGKGEDGLTFLSYDTGNYDAYQKGSLVVYQEKSAEEFMRQGDLQQAEAKEREKQGPGMGAFGSRDLAFCVYRQEIGPYLKAGE